MSYGKGIIYQDTKPPFYLPPPPPPYPATSYPPPNTPMQPPPPPPQHVPRWTYTGGALPQHPGATAAPFHPSTAPDAAAPIPRPSPSAAAHPHVFPPAINGYYSWRSCSTFHIGPTKAAPLHAVKVRSSLFSSKQTIELYAGPTADEQQHAVLAKVQSRGYKDKEFAVEVRAQGGCEAAAVVQVRGVKTGVVSEAARFEVDVGGGRCEAFEWRSSRGAEVKAVAAGCSFGWKLVRLGDGGGAAGRGYASDEKEIVAVVAHNASFSATKGLRFAFLGSGLAGVYGEVWEIAAVASGLKLWHKDLEHIASASG